MLIVVIIFGTTSRERLVRGLKPTNCDSPAVKTHNNQYEVVAGALIVIVVSIFGTTSQ
jgi:hypothetical protein